MNPKSLPLATVNPLWSSNKRAIMLLEGSRVRRVLRDVEWLRNSYYFALELLAAVRDTPAHNRAELDRLHATCDDIWQYSSLAKCGHDRFAREAAVLDRARGARCFDCAIEIGCHEGAFTEWLAPRCSRVLAVDVSPVVLERARRRCSYSNVEFASFDLRLDALPGSFDLIVVVSVLETFRRARDLRSVRDKLVASLRPGGYLLLGNVRGSEVFETAGWAQWMVRGGLWISRLFAAEPRLKTVEQEMDDLYIDSLFRLDDRHASSEEFRPNA
jgi:2-polyprenyl-3-methyl-5-hydroxy-6-metoxy-1,4-benzoquinol methylase